LEGSIKLAVPPKQACVRLWFLTSHGEKTCFQVPLASAASGWTSSPCGAPEIINGTHATPVPAGRA
jgi:hypothetical protein